MACMTEGKGNKTSSGGGLGSVARFPPMPRIPAAPRLPLDERQTRTMRILGAVGRIAAPKMRLGGPNFATGFHASAVDLGQLQATLAKGVARFDAAQVEERWDEILEWMWRVLRTWVQRYKHVKVERREQGIRVELETQDDHGYYSYGFDVFPGQRPAARHSREAPPAPDAST
jgi:hypothetical protein